MSDERITCANCNYCKIWYDKDAKTMRLSCTKTSERGKTITWKSYPLYEMQSGLIVQTQDTIESISKEFKDYSKRRLAPYWCEYRKSNTIPEQKYKLVDESLQYKYLISYAYTGSNMVNFGLGCMELSRKNKINSSDEIDCVLECIKEKCPDNVRDIQVSIINFILLN